MHIGLCTGVENIEKLERLGFDYIEWSVTAAVSLSPEEFKKADSRVRASSIKCEAFNVFFPGNLKIVGREVDSKAVDEYIKGALERIALLGAKAVVVGSGAARKVPEGWDRQRGIGQFAKVLETIGIEAAQYGITVVVEPLNTGETNIINSVREGLSLVKEVNHPHVRLLADFYHMRLEGESMESIVEAGSLLKHLHIANSNGRVYPLNEYEDEYHSFFDALKKTGYSDRISIEASTGNFEKDAENSLKLLRALAT